MNLIKKSAFDICGGECGDCKAWCVKNIASLPVLTKKKVYKKFVPPDTTAIKILLEKQEKFQSIQNLSDDELEKLKEKYVLKLNSLDE